MNISKKIIMNNNVLLNQINLINEFGRSAAQLLCQLHYWLENSNSGVIHEGIKWIYNTAKQWGEQIGLSERQVRTHIKNFSEKGIISVKKINQKRYDQTNYLTINYDKVNEYFDEEILISSQPAITARLSKKKPTILNTENNNIDKYKSDKTVYEKTPDLGVLLHDSQQVEKIEKNILNEEKKIKEQKKATEKNTNELNEDKEIKPGIVQSMILKWKKHFNKNEVILNKEMSRFLVAAFKNKFNSDLSQWEHYLKRIQSSKYLTSEKFVLTLPWAIKFYTIDRIEQGDLGVKEIVRMRSEEELSNKLEEHFKSLNEQEECIDVRRKIAKIIGLGPYLAWFTKVVFVINECGIQFKARTPFERDYITTHYGYLLSK